MRALIGLLLAVSFAASAAPPKPEQLPPMLRDWREWVLHDQKDALCPFLHGTETKECSWPGRLALELDDKGGRFQQTFRVYRDAWLALPGDARRWPQEVKVDGKDAVVVPEGELPTVFLVAGEHLVSGNFFWDSLPEALAIPTDTGLLKLTVKAKEIGLPDRDSEGRVFLQKEASSAEAENLELTVNRLVTDEIPLTLDTRLELNVSGKSREVLLGRALPDGFVPMSLSSAVPVRIEPDGRLRLQVRPGNWTVDLVARHEGPVATLKRPKPDGTWAEGEEVWVFDARASLRQVLVEGVTGVDPQQTRLPAEWKRLPAYAMGAEDVMTLTERRRGDADPAPDRLALERTLWLDFDGEGYTVSDRITGQLHRSWRLDMQPGTELGRVVASGADQSITRLGAGKLAGVELREGNLSIEADSRIGRGREIPAVSWDADFHQVSEVLQLPPGWRLFHASGADEVRDTWVHQWSLLDIFLVLVIALAVGRLFGVRWGVVALVTLTLSFKEQDAPRYVWLAVLAGEALLRVLPEHWVKTVLKLYRFAAWATLVVLFVSFSVDHVRHGMYPALEQVRQLGGVQSWNEYNNDNQATYFRSSAGNLNSNSNVAINGDFKATEKEPEEADTPVLLDGLTRHDAAKSAPMGNVSNPAPQQQQAIKQSKQRSFNVRDYDKNAMVQTGPGLPRWQWRAIPVAFSGPVERAQSLHLWLMPPLLNLVLAFLRVLLLAALVLCLLGFPGDFWPRALKQAGAAAKPLLLAIGLFAVALTASRAQAAEPPGPAPSPELLEQLKQRLLEKPECAPTCAASPRLSLEATPKLLRMRFEVLAGADTAVPLPGSAQHWVPETVLLDDKPASAMRRSGDALWLAVTQGAHQVVLEGPLPARDTVQVALPLKSRRVEAKLDGWTLDGLHEDGLADDNLQLSRKATGQKGEQVALQTGNLPPFVRVTRRLVLGLQWTVETSIERLSPTGSAVVLEVPLLPGESVTTVDVRVQGGKALVNIAPLATSFTWSSVLTEKSPITLEAPQGLPWMELWQLDVSPVWHVQTAGIPVVHQQDAEGVRLPEWRPWPGEKVSIEVVKPDGVPGQTLTIDQSALRLSPGVRATDATLTFNLRSSHGGLHTVTMPADAQLQSVSLNGVVQPIRAEGAKVAIPVVPGSQSVVMTWRQSSGITTAYETPEVQLGIASVNADLELTLPQNRWVLFAGGPRMGPAVLFWSFFLVLLLVSIGLARIPWTPLKTRHWVLLALGLSQVPIPAAAVVFGWLLLVGWREKRHDLAGVARFNIRQLAVVGVTGVALIILVVSIRQGLLGQPDMQVSGNGSGHGMLRWFEDRSSGAFPRGWVFSVPMRVYRGAMLGWSLWIAFALLRWLKWTWASFTTGGIWKKSPPKPPPLPKA